ncbi:ATP-binding cassette domain-containing protein [Xylanibacillus composti]|uniref:Putative ABC transporter ATP-binding protein YlmA n=1 Tax=Xylanibacillus composti TaxID=1572762 RepID=A0A8J4H276_9BACL|nr:ATP-binding cassette domain-containing protein [Xylanibacillus composti]MDT9724237.1 ATP-binding cassette domain-containing protein [Xylanibacillus composti]GIQ68245.1 putative ABC transporter ATP-binding protein YlmA [Xylanibacillus composti]
MIAFDQVTWKRENRTILQNVTFTMNRGEHWVILGRNGSGKTTMLEMINGYLFPTSGTVQVLGETYGQCDVREVRKRIGYISQSLMDKLALRDPVWEVVASGVHAYLRLYQAVAEETEHRARSLLSELRIGHLADQALGTLSQGERKKVMLARAMMANPELLILDEPCSGLDLYERERFLADLQLMSDRGAQFLYVTHHIEEIMPLFTHVLLLGSGRIEAAGTKHEVVTSDLIERAYDVHADLEWFNDRPWAKVRD